MTSIHFQSSFSSKRVSSQFRPSQRVQKYRERQSQLSQVRQKNYHAIDLKTYTERISDDVKFA